MENKKIAEKFEKKFSHELNGYSIIEVNNFLKEMKFYFEELENDIQVLKDEILKIKGDCQNKMNDYEKKLFEARLEK